MFILLCHIVYINCHSFNSLLYCIILRWSLKPWGSYVVKIKFSPAEMLSTKITSVNLSGLDNIYRFLGNFSSVKSKHANLRPSMIIRNCYWYLFIHVFFSSLMLKSLLPSLITSKYFIFSGKPININFKI